MKNKKISKAVIIIAVVLIPFIYSFFYLKAFWDPYGNLKNMKIAIVNDDKGYDNENLGDKLVNKIIEEDIVTVEEVDSSKAENGLIDQQYYATIKIPDNFTKDIKSANEKEKNVTTITYSPNQKSNYLASQIISKVVTQVEKNLRSEISGEVVTSLSDNLNEVPNSLQEISTNLSDLKSGTSELLSGTNTLKNGASKLSFNYSIFDKGIKDLASGITDLNSGIVKISDGINNLSNGTNLLATSTKSLPSITSNLNNIATNSNTINTSISSYVDVNNQTLNAIISSLDIIINNPLSDTDSVNVASNLKQQIQNSNLTAIGTGVKQGETSLNQGIQTISSMTKDLYKITDAASQINGSTNLINTSMSDLKEGSTTITDGITKISNSSTDIKNGLNSIDNGAVSLNNGTSELYGGVNTFKNTIDENITETKSNLESLNGLDTFAADPIKIDEEPYAKVDSYGIGFTPYFVSISLWVGSLILLIVLYYDQNNRFELFGKNPKNKILRTLGYFGLASLQGLILGFLLKHLLSISVTNSLLYYFSFILTANVFLSIIHFFIMEFDDVGKFFSILMLVFQLAASGGTFPIETVPSFFQKIYTFMPMNYSIKLIKESIILENSSMVLKNTLILISILIGFIALTIVSEIIKEVVKKAKVRNVEINKECMD